MGDLIPFGGKVPEGYGKDARDAREIMRRARLAGIKLQADAALYELTFGLVMQLDNLAQRVAMTNPRLAPMCDAMVGNFGLGADHKIQTRHSMLGQL